MLIGGHFLDNGTNVGLAIQSIYGVNKVSASQACAHIGIRVASKVTIRHLPVARRNQLADFCREHFQSNLLKSHRNNIKELINIKHYRGVRHMFGLPCHGQRTRTNAITAKKLAFVRKAVKKNSKASLKPKTL